MAKDSTKKAEGTGANAGAGDKDTTAPLASAPVAVNDKAEPVAREFRQRMAAVPLGGRGFGKGQEPMAKVRLEEAIRRALDAEAHVKTARNILESLKGETVTGTQQSGAEAILGAELPHYEAMVKALESGFASLRGED